MVTATSKSDICNLALDLLLQTNEETVTNIESPNTETEVICARWYDVARRATLRKGVWNFALKRTTLTADATAPLFGYTRAFNLPVDLLRTISIQNTQTINLFPLEDFEIENGQILLDADETATLNLRYIFDQTAVTKFDALFVEVMALELALRMAYKFTSSGTRVQQIETILRDRMAGAKAIDGQERPPRRIEISRSKQRRRRLGSNQRSSATST